MSFSTKEPIEHLRMTQGMNRSVRSFEIGEQNWWTQFQMRNVDGALIQIPRKKTLFSFEEGTGPVTAIQSLPVTGTTNSFLYAFLPSEVQSIRSNSSLLTLVNNGSSLIESDERWATYVFEGRVYFTNLYNKLHYISDHNTIEQFSHEVQPAARYITGYFDHIVMSNMNYGGMRPYRICWSDLRKYGSFKPNRNSEADYFDLLEEEHPVYPGITGQCKLNDRVIFYTSSSIHAMHYTGMPRVMQINPLVEGAGCDFPYGVANLADKLHFFPSRKWRNFYMFDGSVPKPIGDPIISYFIADLNTDPDIAAGLWSYVDTFNSEVWWIYPSTAQTSLVCDKAVIYNYKYNCWYVAAVEDLHCFCPQVAVGRSISDLAGISCSDLSGRIARLSTKTGVFPRMWGSKDQIFVESDNEEDDLRPVANPYLETKDYSYQNAQDVKEIESMFIQANLGTAVGLRVQVSARANVDDTVNWENVTQLWTPAVREGRLSLPRKAGKFIRYKFSPVGENIKGFGWSMFTENVYGAKENTEK